MLGKWCRSNLTVGGSPSSGDPETRREENKNLHTSNREGSEATIIKMKAGRVVHQYGLFIKVLNQTPI